MRSQTSESIQTISSSSSAETEAVPVTHVQCAMLDADRGALHAPAPVIVLMANYCT